MATNLYSIIQGLEVSADEIMQAELLAERILEAKYPDLDLRQGTGLRDLVIRPSATLLAMMNRALAYYFSQNTLTGVTDSSPTEIVDNILSNWFLERKAGKKSVINARMYFATKKNVSIGTETFFSPDNTKKFYPLTTYSFSPSDLIYESFSGEYYADIDLVADKEGSEYDLTSGSLLYFSNFDPYFLRGEINYLQEMATVTETNTQFISRAKTAISTRNLINVPSIDAKLKENFDYITSVTSVGFGDPEMYRDRILVTTPYTLDPVLIHIGGKTDVYTRVPLEIQVYQYPTDVNGVCSIQGPYLEIARSTFSGGSSEDTLPMNRQKPIEALVASGTTATATITGHGFLVGEVVTISGATPAEYNGSFTIKGVSDPNTFTFILATAPASAASGTIIASVPVRFTVRYPSQVTLPATLTKSGDSVTLTCVNHGAMAGRYVGIKGANPVGFNGYFKIQSVTKDTITVTNTNGTLPATPLAEPSIVVVNPMSDAGLSPNQLIEVDFGPAYANKTVSFTVTGYQGLAGIQNFLTSQDRRVLASDPLARGYNVYRLTIHIVGYNGAAPSSALCGQVATSYMESLDPGAPFIMADLISKLNDNGVETIKTPIGISYRYFNRDNIPYQTGTITDFLDPQDSTAIFMLENLTTGNEYI